MRFIKVSESNLMEPMEEDCPERSRNRTVMHLAEAHRAGDLIHEIQKHTRALRYESDRNEQIIAASEHRRRIGSPSYKKTKEKVDIFKRPATSSNTNSYKDNSAPPGRSQHHQANPVESILRRVPRSAHLEV